MMAGHPGEFGVPLFQQGHFATSPDSVWLSIRHDLKLDHKVDRAEVQAEIRKLLRDQEKLQSILTFRRMARCPSA